ATSAGVNSIASVKCGAIQLTRYLSESVLIQSPSYLHATLRNQAPSVGLGHGVIYSRGVTRVETQAALLRRWTVLWPGHQRRLPLAGTHEMGGSTAEGVTKQGQWRDDEPDH